MLKQSHIAKYWNDNESWIKESVTLCLERVHLKCLADLFYQGGSKDKLL